MDIRKRSGGRGAWRPRSCSPVPYSGTSRWAFRFFLFVFVFVGFDRRNCNVIYAWGILSQCKTLGFWCGFTHARYPRDYAGDCVLVFPRRCLNLFAKVSSVKWFSVHWFLLLILIHHVDLAVTWWAQVSRLKFGSESRKSTPLFHLYDFFKNWNMHKTNTGPWVELQGRVGTHIMWHPRRWQ